MQYSRPHRSAGRNERQPLQTRHGSGLGLAHSLGRYETFCTSNGPVKALRGPSLLHVEDWWTVNDNVGAESRRNSGSTDPQLPRPRSYALQPPQLDNPRQPGDNSNLSPANCSDRELWTTRVNSELSLQPLRRRRPCGNILRKRTWISSSISKPKHPREKMDSPVATRSGHRQNCARSTCPQSCVSWYHRRSPRGNTLSLASSKV